MELKEFVTETICAIVEGVILAQERTKSLGATVNPGGLMRTNKSISNDSLWDNSNNNIARIISFDVAVTVEAGAKAEAKIGVASGLLNFGTRGSVDSKEVGFSRVQFSVPLLLPAIEVTGARTKRIQSQNPLAHGTDK